MTQPAGPNHGTPSRASAAQAGAAGLPRRLAGRMLRLGGLLLVGAIIYGLAACALQRTVLFPRHAVSVSDHAQPPAGAERWQIQTDQGPVEAWFLPAASASPENPAPAVMHAHGNGEAIDHWPHALGRYREMGVSVLLAEYRGYGRSAGSPSEHAILADFQDFHDRLAARADVDETRIVFHGRSLGAAVLGTFTTQRQPAAIILESAFTSVPDMARRFGVPRFLLLDRLEALNAVSQFQGPVLILHGENDTVVPVAHAHRFHEQTPHSTLVLYPTNHNQPMPEVDYWRQIQAFLESADIIARP